ncbi:MAG: hypothetical protein JWR24_4519 [Actinoallomurus sp.]|nr:hypothetical protein [Actinoallomurus sp.]
MQRARCQVVDLTAGDPEHLAATTPALGGRWLAAAATKGVHCALRACSPGIWPHQRKEMRSGRRVHGEGAR